MKKSELVIGNYYAYDRSRDVLPFSVSKVKLVSLESEKGYRAKSGTVAVEFTRTRGWGENREEYAQVEYVQLYTLKGDYDTIANKIELRKKDREIQNLKGQIEKNRRVGVQNQYKGAFIKFGVPSYTFSDYRPNFTIAFTEAQFITVSRLLETYNKDLADAQAHAEESQQLSHLIGSN
jgi:predicted transcriptional regulator